MQSGVGHVTFYPRLCFLQLQNGVHYLLPQAVLSGNPPLSLLWDTGDLVLPEDPAVILC